ncbi:ATP-binding protein [Bifidobacterium animalis]|uniref:AlbA family DNA-binding domain-containing protein n=1 Tax=Bifidobacterium animalis TaxID=28025 RepID=UPI000B91EC25
MSEYGRETLTREFKSDRKPLPDSQLIEAIVALSNTEGGALYLGVEDDGTPTGVSEGHADSVGLVAMVDNRTRPSVRVDAILTGSPRIMRIDVPKASTIIATHTGRALR